MAPPGSANGHALDSTLSSLELVSVETVSVSQEKEIFGPETKGRKGPSETVSALQRPWPCAKSRQLARQIARCRENLLGLALGGLKGGADAVNSRYFAVRGLLAKSVVDAGRR
jgi:hypothetical protein